MRTFRLLALRRLRHQPLRAAIAAVAMAAGVSLMVAILAVTSSLERSVDDFGRTLAGPTELRVIGASRSRGGLATEVADRVAAEPGVAAAVPMVQTVTLADPASETGEPVDVLAFGVDCRIQAVLDTFAEGFACTPELLAAAGNQPLVMGAGLAAELGPGASVRTEAGRVSLDGALPVDALDQLGGGRVVVFSLAGAQELFARPGQVDVVYVDPGGEVDVASLRDRLSAVVGEHNAVLGAGDPPPEIGFILAAFVPLFSLLGLFALGTGAVLVHNIVTLSLEERRRQLAVLGSLGATARTIGGGAVGEAALLGLAGGLAGVGGGLLLSGPITASLSDVTESVAGIPLGVHVTSGTIVAGLVLGAVVGAGAAILPARRALRLDVSAELSGRDRASEGRPIRLARRLVIWSAIGTAGLVACYVSSLGGALEPWQAALAPIGFLVTSVGYLIAGAAFAPLLLRPFSSLSARSRRAPLRLAVSNLVRDPRRTGVMATAVASAVIVAFMTTSFITSAKASITESLVENLGGVAVSTVGPNEQLSTYLSPAVQATLADLPEAGTIRRGAIVVAGHDAASIIAVEAFEDPFLDAPVHDGTADPARREGIRAGDVVRLPTPSGMVELPVQGVWGNGDFGGSNVLVSLATIELLYGPQPPTALTIEPAPGFTEGELAAAVLASGADPDLKAWTARELADEIVVSIETQMAPFQVLQRGLLVVAFVAVLSTLLLVGIQRQRELGLLAAVGMRPVEIGRMVVAEAAVVGVLAVVQAAVFGALMLRALLDVIPVLIGFRDPYRPDVAGFAAAAAVAVAVALLASLWPARRAARIEVLEALRYE